MKICADTTFLGERILQTVEFYFNCTRLTFVSLNKIHSCFHAHLYNQMESKSNLRDQFCVSYEAHNTPILMKPSGMFGFNNVVTDKNGAVLACLQLRNTSEYYVTPS